MSGAWVVLAQLLRPQGRKGEILAEMLTDFPEGLVDRSSLHLAKEGFAGTAEEARPCRVTACWMPRGRNEGRIVLGLEGVETIDAAEDLAGYELLVAAEDRAPLEEGAAYISDLVGCSVFDRDRKVGVVEDVEFPASADGRRRLEEASPLLVISLDDGGGEGLIPFTKAFLREFDPVAKVLRMELPEGLLEISKTGDGSTAAEGEDRDKDGQ